ncbi:hypothetical protein A1O3_04605 [Capronia epimyces CBS 606.96]|uniref:LYC1 C-terminal domain-containing protein n=1 Tax=Capronia epimyces CBS 606.96 TaxID=1182542 RepID=W9XUP7_9EURO|nr:uncharacterized protein A1O3_04605 [Capronia epimyces CBS 606.96]EXJ83938.1 hypothetical protein A1O3_04605 [Capronia epimyces CBS 606.96]
MPPAVEPVLQPDSQSSELILAVATPVEHVQTAQLNVEEWKGSLTTEQYLHREAALHSTDLTRNGGITCWILTSESLPTNADGTRPIFASCESILYHADVVRNGILEQVRAHGIGTVYTRAEYRGKGYAGRMMADLGPKLETWQQVPDVKNAFSVLFSDIGPSYYARFGWKVFPSNHIHLPPLDENSYGISRMKLPAVEDLSASDLPGIPAVDYLQHELRKKSRADPDTVYLAIRPTIEHFAWHHAREEFICSSLERRAPTIKGALHRATGIVLVWNRVFAESQKDWQLQILQTVIPPDAQNLAEANQAMAALLLRAQFEAHQSGMLAGVQVWDPPNLVMSSVSEILQGPVNLIERHKESICCLRWSGEHDDKLMWISKQKYTWC